MKQRGQSLRCLRLLHLLKKIMLFERTRHWKNIYASMVIKKKFRERLNYYEDTFIGRHHRTGRSKPLFPIRLCNQSERTENGISRTNNKVEGGHNAFARLVGGNHPNIFKFLVSLQRELSLVDVKIDTIHMRTTQQNIRPIGNQINRQLN
ncbi:hypothetical protein HZS_529 [Henneguya salminicola]|nr:hypothetical protein HZS_529 [Henneguya salminicola]